MNKDGFFKPSLLSPAPGKELQKALKEAEEMRNDLNRKGYNNINELIKDL